MKNAAVWNHLSPVSWWSGGHSASAPLWGLSNIWHWAVWPVQQRATANTPCPPFPLTARHSFCPSLPVRKKMTLVSKVFFFLSKRNKNSLLITSTLSPALAPFCEKLEQLSISSPWRQRTVAVTKPLAADRSDQTDLQSRSSSVRKHNLPVKIPKPA